MQRDDVLQLVLTSLDEALADVGITPDAPIREMTPLIGRNSVLDSLGLVQLVVSVEQRLQDERGISVTVADDRAMSQRNSPFRTVDALTDYVHMLVTEQRTHV